MAGMSANRTSRGERGGGCVVCLEAVKKEKDESASSGNAICLFIKT